jgi:hypothetical protein
MSAIIFLFFFIISHNLKTAPGVTNDSQITWHITWISPV